jgi:hypothetical protein
MARALEVELPTGATAKFRDPKVLTKGQRKVAQNEMLAQAGTDVATDEAFRISDVLVVTLVESWSYDFALTKENLDLMPALDADALMVEATERIEDYWLNIGPTPDPKAPTGASSESGGSLAVEAATTDTPSPLSSPITSS